MPFVGLYCSTKLRCVRSGAALMLQRLFGFGKQEALTIPIKIRYSGNISPRCDSNFDAKLDE